MTSNDKKTGLRFAVMPRVSTPTQERKGESLLEQRDRLRQDVELLDGVIVKDYGGQEHASGIQERERLIALTRDASKSVFDAVMFGHLDRFDRGSKEAQDALDAFKKHRIRFFVSVTEFNLYEPSHEFQIDVARAVAKFQASNQSKKSLLNRIHRARRGIPTVAKRPYGRVWDKKTGWSIDQDKQRIIAEVARRYLAGEDISKLMLEHRWRSRAYLYDTLRTGCGPTWTLHFCDKRFDIDETVTLTVPEILDKATIQAVRQRLTARRTYLHGAGKRKYLLSGRIFCAACGLNLVGHWIPPSNGTSAGYRYYRHSQTGAKKCPCRPLPNVNAWSIEDSAVGTLFDMFGNPAQIVRATRAAVPQADESMKRRQRLTADIDKVNRARQDILTLLEEEAITREEAKARLAGQQERLDVLQGELDHLEEALANVPSEADLRCYVEKIEDAMGGNPSIFVYDDNGEPRPGGNDVGTYITMSWDDKKHLIDAVFSSGTLDGKPAGVYVWLQDGKRGRPKKVHYTIKGRLDFEMVCDAVRVSFDTQTTSLTEAAPPVKPQTEATTKALPIPFELSGVSDPAA